VAQPLRPHQAAGRPDGPTAEGMTGLSSRGLRGKLQQSIHRLQPCPRTLPGKVAACAGEPDHATEPVETTIEPPKSKDRPPPRPAKIEAPVIVARLKRAAVGSYATAADEAHQRTLLPQHLIA